MQRRLRLFRPPIPDPKDLKLGPPIWKSAALWLALGWLMLEAVIWLNEGFGGNARQVLALSHGLLPAQAFGLVNFSGFPIGLWLQVCGPDHEPSEVCTALAAWANAYYPAEPWRVLSYQALHTDFRHAIMNAFALLLFAPHALARMGNLRFVLFFLISGAAGAVGVLVLSYGPDLLALRAGWPADYANYPGFTGLTPVIGASGAVFGVWLASLRFEWDRLRRLPSGLRTEDPRMALYAALIWGIILNVVFMVLPMGISGEAHIGGAVFGFVMAPFFQRPGFLAERRRLDLDDGGWVLGESDNDPNGARYGCFLPDLTGLARRSPAPPSRA